MADDPTGNPPVDPPADPPVDPPADPPADPPSDADIESVAEKAENPDAVRKALKAEREAAKRAQKERDDALAKVKEFEDRDKTEQERQAERLAELEGKLTPLEQENLRLRVAYEKSLPPELADRLVGEDRESLEADADQLLALVTKTPDSRGSADQGARKGGKNQLSRADLKSMSPDEINKAREEGRLERVLTGG